MPAAAGELAPHNPSAGTTGREPAIAPSTNRPSGPRCSHCPGRSRAPRSPPNAPPADSTGDRCAAGPQALHSETHRKPRSRLWGQRDTREAPGGGPLLLGPRRRRPGLDGDHPSRLPLSRPSSPEAPVQTLCPPRVATLVLPSGGSPGHLQDVPAREGGTGEAARGSAAGAPLPAAGSSGQAAGASSSFLLSCSHLALPVFSGLFVLCFQICLSLCLN